MYLEEPTSSILAMYICNLILLCIFVSCVEIIFDSVINNKGENSDYSYYSYYLELVLFIIFGTEYIMRLLTSTAFGDRIYTFLISPMNIVDLISILPFLLSIFMQSSKL